MFTSPGARRGQVYGLLRLQDKIDQMTLAKRPTEVRLQENGMAEFVRQVREARERARAGLPNS